MTDFVKFDMNTMPLEAIQPLYFSSSCHQ